MPKYMIHNPTACLIHIPGTGLFIKPKANLRLDVQPMVLATSEMQTLLSKGHLRMAEVVETPLISDHIEIPVVDMLNGGTGGTGTGWDRIGISLIQQVDKREWRVPEAFVHTIGELSIEVFHQAGGRRLQRSPTGNPCDGDYTLEESGGIGTGYDTVRMLSFTPKALKANYRTV